MSGRGERGCCWKYSKQNPGLGELRAEAGDWFLVAEHACHDACSLGAAILILWLPRPRPSRNLPGKIHALDLTRQDPQPCLWFSDSRASSVTRHVWQSDFSLLCSQPAPSGEEALRDDEVDLAVAASTSTKSRLLGREIIHAVCKEQTSRRSRVSNFPHTSF